MGEQQWFGWLVSIRRTRAWGKRKDWQQCFRDVGRERLFSIAADFFGSDDQMWSGGKPVGRFRFVDKDEVKKRFGDRSWFELSAPCDWVGGVAGFLNFEWWTPDVDDRLFDVERFIGTGKGFLVRLEDDEVWHGIAENTYRLADANEKHGFGDGADLLDVGPDYDAYVWETITHALAEIGLAATKINYGTGHNHVRFDDLIPSKKRPWGQRWDIFDAHRNAPLKLWGYNNQLDALRLLLDDSAPDT